MSSSINFEAELSNKQSTIKVGLTLISFEEDNILFVYCPALDLTGYGYTEDEAKESFSQTLKIHINYTTRKKTFFKDLEKHGWVIKNRKRPKSPDFDYLLKNNKQFKEIVNKRNFTKYSQEIQLPESVYA